MKFAEAEATLPANCAPLGSSALIGAKTHDCDTEWYRDSAGGLWAIRWMPHRHEWSAAVKSTPTSVEAERLGLTVD